MLKPPAHTHTSTWMMNMRTEIVFQVTCHTNNQFPFCFVCKRQPQWLLLLHQKQQTNTRFLRLWFIYTVHRHSMVMKDQTFALLQLRQLCSDRALCAATSGRLKWIFFFIVSQRLTKSFPIATTNVPHKQTKNEYKLSTAKANNTKRWMRILI